MKAVFFAGGVGTRLWPLSRKKSPKQFEKIMGGQSMLQIAVRKLFPEFAWEDIYISTGKHYEKLVREQLPELPFENIIVEPQMRDVGPAVGLITSIFAKKNPNEPVALLWGSDHLVKNEELFRKVLRTAESLIQKEPNKIVFVGQKPRFASQNLGYIEFGKEVDKVNDLPVNEFTGFQYRPDADTAKKFLTDNKHSWNLGYFVTTPAFLWSLFQKFAPGLHEDLQKIHDAYGTAEYAAVLEKIYPTIEKISFDNAILEKMDPRDGYVISADIGWSDVGAWEALKEALEKTPEDNVTHGNVLTEDSTNNLVYNYDKDKMIVAVDLEDILVVNTPDVLLVAKKSSVSKIKKVVEGFAGTDNEHLT